MPTISRFKLTPLNRAIRVFGVALLLSSQQAYSQTVAPPVNVDIQPMNPVTYDQISTGTGAVCASQYDNLINGLDATKVASDVTLNAFEAGAMATEEADWDAMAAGFTALAAGLDDVAASGTAQSAGADAADAGTIALGVMLGDMQQLWRPRLDGCCVVRRWCGRCSPGGIPHRLRWQFCWCCPAVWLTNKPWRQRPGGRY